MDANKIHLENIGKSLKDIERAISSINKSQNPELLKLVGHLKSRKKELEDSRSYYQKLVDGPWMDNSGWIKRGCYEGLYLRPLFETMAKSAWDFPTAVMNIGKSVQDPEILKIDATMYPTDEPESNRAYGVFMRLAPEIDWPEVFRISWDT